MIYCNGKASTEKYTYRHNLYLNDALPIWAQKYDRGIGDDKDARQAFFWANRAVGRGSAAPDILILVAEGYADGEYIPRDVRRAEKMLIAAIEQGNPTAMLRLGQLYFSFQDARAPNEAVGWLRRASPRGQSSPNTGKAP